MMKCLLILQPMQLYYILFIFIFMYKTITITTKTSNSCDSQLESILASGILSPLNLIVVIKLQPLKG